ncbi:DISARM system SNF2-like helicase DrmD [Cyanobium sp. HWJ4-Hawea]|uniref:DISARM system SNF2-like helicase DrmD n=1 Tax=Cyanobium sp. HWJ4-Hawea TaxID=2823713 RepID=UPI0020CDBC60|nr:DISARM system SNF2-like helicase DrmD [Cyanobium sp. HWJ4-Hawea]
MTKPSKGCVVYCRSHHHLVEDVKPPEDGGDTVVRLACLDDDANGQITEVFWEREVDARVLGQSTWETIGQRGFDDPRVFSSYLHTLQWNCVTATDPGLFQAPLRAGIDVKPYQLEPLRKALRMPRVALFIADDVGLGKTIEAGLIVRELLMRQKVQRVVVVPPPSVVLQWQGEMESRFGLPFQVMNRDYVSRMRRERGWGINPWATHTRFILSQALVRNEDYAGALRDWLGDGERALLILDEAHNAAPASGSKIAVDSKLTRAIRSLASCFEHKLFLSATPHNGHSNSFSALLEILDPTRFCRGVPVRNKADLEPVLVRRLKEDLRRIGEELPKREVVPVVIDGLDPATPELELARLLKAYRALREQRLKGAGSKQRAAELLVVTNLQKRLLSSIEAFHRTLGVHCDTLQRRDAGERLRTARDPAQLKLLQQAIDGDDERADADEDSVEREAEQEHRLALATTELGAGPEEWALLKDMQRISERARYGPDARIHYLRRWIEQHLCPDLAQEGAQWNGERLLIFTEYADTKRWLQEQIESLIAGSDRERERIATFHGGIGDEKREALKRSFNSPPELDPLRILIATDAAREGVNLQNHCRYLFHFDVPWNPGRMEQRNGRIDRTLQRAPEVFCHYFVLADRDEDRVLDVLVQKTEEIRKALGSLPPVVVGRLNELLAKGINPTAIQEVMEQIQGVDQEEGTKRSQALINLELEDNSRERDDELRQQVGRLEKALQKSEDWLHFSSDLFRDALNTSLRVSAQGSGVGSGLVPQLTARDPAAAQADPERAEWIFPAADELPGGEQSWGDVLDALRRPRQPGEKLWEWRRNTVPQPVVFKDPKEVNADRVHLHLEHPLVQRLLNRFLVRGFQGEELSRAAVIATNDDTAKLILLARLSLYGHGAARLHDEVLELVAEWDPADPTRRLRVLNATKTDMALADLETSLRQRLPAVDEAIQHQLRVGLPADVAQLKDRLEALAAERAERARGQLGKRAEDEANAFVKVLQEQRERILKTRTKHDSEFDQLAFGFADQELRQLRDNRSHWDKRLARIERELELEPAAIRRTFEVATAPRIEPAGAIVLWPLEAAR